MLTLSQIAGMKLCLASIAAMVGMCLGAWAQMPPVKAWPHGPYDKVIPQKPPGSVFGSPPPLPPLRGAMVPVKIKTNAPIVPGTLQSK